MSSSKIIGFIAGPALFVTVYLFLTNATAIDSDMCKVLAVAAWLVSWWLTEAVHVSITALIPMVLLPWLGVMTVKDATSAYGNPVIFLFMGGFFIALALEKHNLHQRIALNLIKLTGTSGNGIILGFCIATAIISMWISNTATAIMMLPIATSVTQLLSNGVNESSQQGRNYRNFGTGLMLCIAYSASIGGMATIIGTPPNVVMAGLYRSTYEQDIAFSEWIKVGLPIAVVVLAICYFLITRVIFPNHLKNVNGSEQLIRTKLAELGRISFSEKLVLMVFTITSSAWIFRGYLNIFLTTIFYNDGSRHTILDDTSIAIAGGLLMFCIPVSIKRSQFLLSWEDTKRLPWGILILFGGGICLANSMEDVGLIQMIGSFIAEQGQIKIWILVSMLAFISLFLTELMSNVALTTIFIPVVFGIADGLGYDPLVLAMPVTFAASCAFTMPVSTPPNAILFASGLVRLKDMMRAGIVLNFLSLATIILLSLLLVGS